MNPLNHKIRKVTILVLLTILLIGLSGVASAQVSVMGEFDGELVGYGEDSNEDVGDFPNQIVMEGEFAIEGEDAVDTTIEFDSGPNTVLDTSSIEVLVPGGIDFDRNYGPDSVRETTDEIPAGTTIQISFVAYFKGGTDADSIDAGEVTIDYESPGGTSGEESFTVEVDSTNSADNEINNLEQGESLGSLQELLSYLGGVTVVAIILLLVLKIVGGRGGPDNGGPKRPN